MPLDEPPSSTLPPDIEVQCPDCGTALEYPEDADRRVTTDGGRPGPDPGGDRELRGVDVACTCCGTELGIYVFP